MIILVSPAKSLDFESQSPFNGSSEIQFAEEAAYLSNKLKKFSPRKLKSLMNISADLANLNSERYGKWKFPFSEDTTKQSVFAFTGDVYQGLEAGTLSEEELNYAQDHLRILSGLYGVLRPLDQIMPYRLEMGTKWAVTPKKKNLYTYWDNKIHNSLKEDLEGSGSQWILNLASAEYAKAAKLKAFDVQVVSPDFLEERDGKFQMISFFAKKARGLMTRFAIQNKIENVDDLMAFDLEGYHFNRSLSNTDQNKWVFTRINQ